MLRGPRSLDALLLVCFALFASPLLAEASAIDPDVYLHGDQADVPGPPFHALSVNYAAGLSATGSIIGSSQTGLQFLEDLINTGILYNPVITPGVRSAGPFYRIPEIALWSNFVSLQYEHDPLQDLAWGASFSFLDINGRVDIPDTYLYSPELPIDASNLRPPLAYQVTKRSAGRIPLASVLQLEGFLIWRANGLARMSPYARLIFGGGRGWLGYVGKGPYVQEAHLGLALGFRFRLAAQYFINLEGGYNYYQARTGPSNFFDRTETLVNPRRGNLQIARIGLGAGLMF
ncbi:MAG: hypothetical protein K1X75_10955 [Leptospirales bacterium]|nr:hypothetical protein [Leptospirales bacterium]